jgi:hypothetical protein
VRPDVIEDLPGVLGHAVQVRESGNRECVPVEVLVLHRAEAAHLIAAPGAWALAWRAESSPTPAAASTSCPTMPSPGNRQRVRCHGARMPTDREHAARTGPAAIDRVLRSLDRSPDEARHAALLPGMRQHHIPPQVQRNVPGQARGSQLPRYVGWERLVGARGKQHRPRVALPHQDHLSPAAPATSALTTLQPPSQASPRRFAACLLPGPGRRTPDLPVHILTRPPDHLYGTR